MWACLGEVLQGGAVQVSQVVGAEVQAEQPGQVQLRHVLQPRVRQPSHIKQAVLRIRDAYPDPGSEFFPSRIRIKEFKSILTPKKWFLRSLGSMIRVAHSGSRIPDPDFFYQSRIPDPEIKKAPDPGSRIPDGQ